MNLFPTNSTFLSQWVKQRLKWQYNSSMKAHRSRESRSRICVELTHETDFKTASKLVLKLFRKIFLFAFSEGNRGRKSEKKNKRIWTNTTNKPLTSSRGSTSSDASTDCVLTSDEDLHWLRLGPVSVLIGVEAAFENAAKETRGISKSPSALSSPLRILMFVIPPIHRPVSSLIVDYSWMNAPRGVCVKNSEAFHPPRVFLPVSVFDLSFVGVLRFGINIHHEVYLIWNQLKGWNAYLEVTRFGSTLK